MNEVDLRRLKNKYKYEIGELALYSESFFSFFPGNRRYLSDDELKIVEKKFEDIIELLAKSKIDRGVISTIKGVRGKISKNRRIQWGDFQLLKDILAGINP